MSGAPVEESLFGDVTTLIEAARGRVAVTVNAELTMLYWGIGRRLYQRWLDRYERVPGWWPRPGSWGRGRSEGRWWFQCAPKMGQE
jgi:hypothetical protein